MKFGSPIKLLHIILLMLAVFAATTTPASADMVLSQVIVDFKPDRPPLQDIEVWNDGDERLYVAADPARIVDPGQLGEARRPDPDPTELGLLVSPQRLVLEPDQRRIIRVAAIAERDTVDRVYRVAIKPVAGPLHSQATALKVLVGYDALIIVRPQTTLGEVTATRQGRRIVFHNGSNTAQELFSGAQCAGTAGSKCTPLPAKRLYAGVDWALDLPHDAPVEFSVTDGSRTRRVTFR
jgi:P pilus assembly chaperone PapD